jgi:hypothetical protein
MKHYVDQLCRNGYKQSKQARLFWWSQIGARSFIVGKHRHGVSEYDRGNGQMANLKINVIKVN